MNAWTWRSASQALLVAAVAVTAPLAHGQNASMVVRDAATGQLRAPTADEARAMAASRGIAAPAISGSRGLVTGSTTPLHRVLANGTVVHEATEDTMSATVVVRGQGGKLVRQCAGNLATADLLAQGRRTSFAKNMLERHDAVK